MVSRIKSQLVSAIAANTVLSPTSTESAADSSLTSVASENHNSVMDRPYWSSLSSGFESSYDSHWDYADSRALQNGLDGLQYRRRSSSNDSEFYDYLKINERSSPFSAAGEVGDVADMAQQWEQHVAEKNKNRIYMAHHQHSYDFPRWRSSDALSASLVASRENIAIPPDSNLPSHRLKMMQQTEVNAKIDKEKLHLKAAAAAAAGQGRISRSSSMDSSALQLDYEPWYDRKMIRENIIRESIANSKETRKRFENGLIWKETEKQHGRMHSGEIAKPLILQEYREETPNITQFAVEIQPSSKEIKDERSRSLEKEEVENGEVFVRDEIGSADGYRRPNGIPLYGLSNQEQKVLSFLKENIDVIEELGIAIPRPLKMLMEDEKTLLNQNFSTADRGIIPKQEKSYDEEKVINYWDNESTKRRSVTPARMYRVDSIRSSSDTSWLDSNSEPLSYSPGHKTWQHRFRQSVNTPPPENKRPIVEVTNLSSKEVDHSMPGRTLIAAEIRLQNDREDELKRSRSELGLPDLQETFQIWKYGYNSDGSRMPQRGSS